MKLTPENKNHIDTLSYYGLLFHWRFAPAGDPWFEGETCEYWAQRMSNLRSKDNEIHVRASKAIDWEK